MSDQNTAPSAPVEAVESTEPETAVEQTTEQAEGQPQEDTPTQAKQEAKQILSKYKIKVDGKEEEVDLETLKREFSKSKAADKRFVEAAKLRKESEQLIEELKKNPRKVLENPKLGVDFRKMAEDYLREQIELEMMTPEQKKIREYEKLLAEKESEQAEIRHQQEIAREEALFKHYAEDYDKSISAALLTAGLPRSPRTVARMAELMERSIEFGIDVKPADLVPEVRKTYINDIKDLFSSADGDTLLAILGDDIANKIRKSDLKRLTQAAPEFTKSESTRAPRTPSSSKEKGREYISVHEWREQLEKKFGK